MTDGVLATCIPKLIFVFAIQKCPKLPSEPIEFTSSGSQVAQSQHLMSSLYHIWLMTVVISTAKYLSIFVVVGSTVHRRGRLHWRCQLNAQLQTHFSCNHLVATMSGKNLSGCHCPALKQTAGQGWWQKLVHIVASMCRQCLKVIRSWTKSVKWAESPGQTPGHAWMGPNPPGECKMWCSDEIIIFSTQTDTQTHTHTRHNL